MIGNNDTLCFVLKHVNIVLIFWNIQLQISVNERLAIYTEIVMLVMYYLVYPVLSYAKLFMCHIF